MQFASFGWQRQMGAGGGGGGREALVIDGAWTWFNDPRVLFYNENKYLVGAVRGAGDGQGDIIAAEINSLNVGTLAVIEAAFEYDDHDNPGFLRRASDNKFMAFYTAHNNTPRLMMAVSASTSPTAWAAPTNIASALGHTILSYAHPVQLESGRIYLFYRAVTPSEVNAWHYSYSDNDGVTWASGVQLTTNASPYHVIKQNGNNRIDFICNDGHPINVSTNGTYHYYLLETEGTITFHKSDGTEITGLPFDNSDWTQIYDGSGARSWVWDLVIDPISGHPVATFATFVGGTEHRYRQARWDGTSWTARIVCDAGGYLYEGQPFYSGGVITNPSNINEIFAVRQVNESGSVSTIGTHQLFQYMSFDDGVSWVTKAQITFGADTVFRPYKPIGGNKIFYCIGRYTTYEDYDTVIENIDQPEPLVGPLYIDTFATNDLSGFDNVSTGAGTVDASSGSAVFTGTDGSNRAILRKTYENLTVGIDYNIINEATISSGQGFCGCSSVSTFPPSQPPTHQGLGGETTLTFTATAATMYVQWWTPSAGGGSFALTRTRLEAA